MSQDHAAMSYKSSMWITIIDMLGPDEMAVLKTPIAPRLVLRHAIEICGQQWFGCKSLALAIYYDAGPMLRTGPPRLAWFVAQARGAAARPILQSRDDVWDTAWEVATAIVPDRFMDAFDDIIFDAHWFDLYQYLIPGRNYKGRLNQ